MISDAERAILQAFRDTEYASAGEWWAGVPLGFDLAHGNIREVDGVCITSRSPEGSGLRTESRDWFRKQRASGWLDGERVTLVEVKSSGGTWRALGQLIVYRELFDMDWDATVAALVIVADAGVPGQDSEFLFDVVLDQAALIIHEDGSLRRAANG